MKRYLVQTIFRLSIALYALYFGGVAHALEKTVGKVLISSGNFYARNAAGEKRALQRGAPILEKDTLITEKGRAQIRFLDGALVTLDPKTAFKVNEYAAEAVQQSSGLTLLKGGFRTLTGFIAKKSPEHYLVKTPVATIGVRGTHYKVTSPPDCLTVGPTAPACRFTVWRAEGHDDQKVAVTINNQVFLLDDLHQALLVEAGIPKYADVSDLDAASGLEDLDLGEFSAEDEKFVTQLLSQWSSNDLQELSSFLDTLDAPTLATLLSDDTLGSLRISDL